MFRSLQDAERYPLLIKATSIVTLLSRTVYLAQTVIKILYSVSCTTWPYMIYHSSGCYYRSKSQFTCTDNYMYDTITGSEGCV